MKKELDETHILIDKVLEKLQSIITLEKNYNLEPEKLEKLRNIHDSILSLKKSTNISKLKEIGELALLKIGNIELGALEDKKDQESKKLLSDTNTLLKKIGSNKQFKEKNKDIGYLFSLFTDAIKEKFLALKNIENTLKERKEKKLIDKESYSYIKTQLLLEKYQDKYKENNKELVANILAIIFPF